MNDIRKFKEELSTKEKFYSSLKGKKFSGKEYGHVRQFLNKLEMKTLKDYHDLYLKCDVSLLPDLFEKFRNNSSINYGLCSSDYLNAQALSWDPMLNITKVELELITDPDMYVFFEKGMKGGVSYISNTYKKASNKYLKSYDPNQESKHIIQIIYMDVQCLSLFQRLDSNR